MATNSKVCVGQVWRDNDPRSNGRTVAVERIVQDGERKWAVCTSSAGRSVMIRLDRFVSSRKTGYTLVKDVLS